MHPSIVHSTHCNTVTTHVTYDTLNPCQLQHYKVYCTTNSVIIINPDHRILERRVLRNSTSLVICPYQVWRL